MMRSSPTGGRPTLAQFLIESRREVAQVTGEFDGLLTDIGLACKAIALQVSRGVLATPAGETAHTNAHGEVQRPLDVISNELFLRATEWSGHLAGMVSEELDEPWVVPPPYVRGNYLLCFDPLDGSSNIDVNMSVGSIFSVRRAARAGDVPTIDDFLRPGTEQVCAGYAVYGPAAMLVLTLGQGTHAFTLDPQLGEWVLTHPRLTIAPTTREFAINASNRRHWEPAVAQYVEECLAGEAGPRGVNFNMRWIASLVAEAHRILMRGGVFLYPADARAGYEQGRLRLLYEVHPIAMLIEQAGGWASDGLGRAMDVTPASLHERRPFVFGAQAEVSRVERMGREARTPEC
ncbi:class 1 fructose-bisphosphatase [Gemmatimonas sp.]|jgi:fructose-1,6-bisphosphatase I/sedoheptulose-1,7-bisphosphatase|uniref:class 1 fructose-bisphosphatase n=1 Tax=Gemmatimonas sp. TaxID=1962908 RepID=UPI0037BF0B1A